MGAGEVPSPCGPHTAEQIEKGVENQTMKKRILSLALALALSLSLVAPALAVYETPTFTDVPKSFWGYVSIEKAAENKWISGNPDGTFAPNANVTYAQFCVMLVSAFFPEQLASYTGPSSPWYAPSCTIAAQNDLLLGTRIEQTPTLEGAVSQPMSRYEMALMVSNTLYKINAKIPTPKERADQMDTTPDFWDIEYKYQSPVLLAKATGVLSGMDSAGTFGGSGNLSRAQAAVVLGKLNDLRNTGDGSAVNPNLPEPTTPEISVQTLPNGKPFTDENILAIIEELKQEYPIGTGWGGKYTPDGHGGHIDTTAPDNHWYTKGGIGGPVRELLGLFHVDSMYGCGGFAAMVSDSIFGKYGNPVRVLEDHTKIRPGDIIEYITVDTGDSRHWAVAITTPLPAGFRPIGGGAFMGWSDNTVFTGDGNVIVNGVGTVDWQHTFIIGNDTGSDAVVVYTRYQDAIADAATSSDSPTVAARKAVEAQKKVIEQKKAKETDIYCQNCGFLMQKVGGQFNPNGTSGYGLCSTCHKYFVCAQCFGCQKYRDHIATCKG